MQRRGTETENQGGGKFPSVYEGVVGGRRQSAGNPLSKETRFGRETQARMEDDIEAIFGNDGDSDSDSDVDQDEVDGGLNNDLKSLREACLPLSEKIRPKPNQGERRTVGAEVQAKRLKRWPQIKQEAAREQHTFGESKTNMEAWGSRATEVKNSVNRFTFWTDMLRKVEGKFGSGVFNYFKFLKWSMGLNLCLAFLTFCLIILPQYISKQEPVNPSCPSQPMVNNMSLWFPPNQTKACCTEQWQLKQTNYKAQHFNWPPTDAGNFFGMVGLDFSCRLFYFSFLLGGNGSC